MFFLLVYLQRLKRRRLTWHGAPLSNIEKVAILCAEIKHRRTPLNIIRRGKERLASLGQRAIDRVAIGQRVDKTLWTG